MTRRLAQVAVVCALAVSGLSFGVMSASGVGQGTHTAITTPTHNLYVDYDPNTPGANHFPVAGTTSADVTSVDIVCTFDNGNTEVAHLASGVPVTNGAFTTSAMIQSPTVNCRLRAVPTGVDASTAYLDAYTGPILYIRYVDVAIDAGTQARTGYFGRLEQGDGAEFVADAGGCALTSPTTLQRPALSVTVDRSQDCNFQLSGTNYGGNGSAVQVDGKNGYLPSVVHSYLNGPRALGLAEPSLSVGTSFAANGDDTITEADPIMRCSADETYPPTPASCPSLVSTGVTLIRVLHYFRDGHQISVRDQFRSTDGRAHSLVLHYDATFHAPPAGDPGYDYPAHGAAFVGASLGQVVTKFGRTAGTMFIRSDRFAAPDAPFTDTVGITWSRPPASVRFHNVVTGAYALNYTASVPAGGRAFLGFALSERLATSGVRVLARLADRDMMRTPTITSPHAGAVVHRRVTVRGALAAGANGLPTSASVNGHAAAIKTTGATSATYTVTFPLSAGKHKITVTAKDSAGNAASRSITVTSKG